MWEIAIDKISAPPAFYPLLQAPPESSGIVDGLAPKADPVVLVPASTLSSVVGSQPAQS
jgi:hypothetical protein